MPPPPPPGPPPPVASGGGPPNALLKSIQKGAKLKKTVTNDRSGPIIDTKPSSGGGPMGGARPSLPGNRSPPSSRPDASSGPQVGGLFAGGIPKLRPNGSNRTGNPTFAWTFDHLLENQRACLGSESAPVPQPRVPVAAAFRSTANPPVNPPPTVPVVPSSRSAPIPQVSNNSPPPPPRRSPPVPARNPTVGKGRPPPPIPPSRGVVSPRGSTSEPSHPSGPPPIVPRFANRVSPPSSPKVTDDELRWTFKSEIPLPRSFPSGEPNSSELRHSHSSNRASRPPPPPPPGRSSVSGAKRPPPPPPPRS